MSSIPEDPADRFALYRGLRRAGHSAEVIAGKWELGSPEPLFRLLRQDGFPLCEACGEYSKLPLCGKHKRKRKPWGTGRAEELPPTANAAGLFSPVVDAFSDAVRDLNYRAERYRAGRFEKADVHQGMVAVPFLRKLFSEERWRIICEAFGQDPDQESFTIPDQVTNAVGASASPRETALIAAYFILEEPEQSVEQKAEALLEALHHDLSKADRQKLLYGNLNNPEQHPGKIEELRRVARQVARLMRGAPIGGAPAEELTGAQLNLAWYITDQLQAGRPYEEIKRELIDRGLKESEVDFLKSLGISPPSPPH